MNENSFLIKRNFPSTEYYRTIKRPSVYVLRKATVIIIILPKKMYLVKLILYPPVGAGNRYSFEEEILTGLVCIASLDSVFEVLSG